MSPAAAVWPVGYFWVENGRAQLDECIGLWAIPIVATVRAARDELDSPKSFCHWRRWRANSPQQEERQTTSRPMDSCSAGARCATELSH